MAGFKAPLLDLAGERNEALAADAKNPIHATARPLNHFAQSESHYCSLRTEG